MEIKRRRSNSEDHGKSMLRGQEEKQEPVGDAERGPEGWNENQNGLLPDSTIRLMSMRLKCKKKNRFLGFVISSLECCHRVLSVEW